MLTFHGAVGNNDVGRWRRHSTSRRDEHVVVGTGLTRYEATARFRAAAHLSRTQGSASLLDGWRQSTGCSPNGVELLGSYSNQDIVSRLQRLVAGQGRDDPPARTTRSTRRNLPLEPDKVRELLAAYAAGTPIDRVAKNFGVHRTTVLNVVGRSDVERRWNVIDRHLEEAQALYESGLSLKKVGEHFGVSMDSVRNAFLKHRVPIRPRHGWRY